MDSRPAILTWPELQGRAGLLVDPRFQRADVRNKAFERDSGFCWCEGQDRRGLAFCLRTSMEPPPFTRATEKYGVSLPS